MPSVTGGLTLFEICVYKTKWYAGVYHKPTVLLVSYLVDRAFDSNGQNCTYIFLTAFRITLPLEAAILLYPTTFELRGT